MVKVQLHGELIDNSVFHGQNISYYIGISIYRRLRRHRTYACATVVTLANVCEVVS